MKKKTDPNKVTKIRLLRKLRGLGHIANACAGVGIARRQYYHWLDSDKTFKKSARKALAMYMLEEAE